MIKEIGYKPSYSTGINHNIKKETAVLRYTEYYKDDLSYINKVKLVIKM